LAVLFLCFPPQTSNPVKGGNQHGKRNGKVVWFNESKGFGFISQEDGPDVFAHYSEIAGDGFKTLAEGDKVSFEITDGAKGPKATNIVRQ